MARAAGHWHAVLDDSFKFEFICLARMPALHSREEV